MEKQAQTQATQPKQFDLHTRGYGYLNRVRWVDVQQGNRKAKFLSCGIRAMSGSSDALNWTPFDVKVVGQDMIDLIDSLLPHVEAERKVSMSFTIGDIYPHLYQRLVMDKKTRCKTGEMEWACLIKGRLIGVDLVKVDGQVVYRRPRSNKADEQQVQGDPQSAAQAVPVTSQPAQQPMSVEQPSNASPAQAERGWDLNDYDEDANVPFF